MNPRLKAIFPVGGDGSRKGRKQHRQRLPEIVGGYEIGGRGEVRGKPIQIECDGGGPHGSPDILHLLLQRAGLFGGPMLRARESLRAAAR